MATCVSSAFTRQPPTVKLNIKILPLLLLKALREIGDHENIVRLFDAFPNASGIVLVFECLVSDLQEVLQEHGKLIVTTKSREQLSSAFSVLPFHSIRMRFLEHLASTISSLFPPPYATLLSEFNIHTTSCNSSAQIVVVLVDAIVVVITGCHYRSSHPNPKP